MSSIERSAKPIPAVDAVRLVSAVWVEFSHLGGPPLDEIARLAGACSLAKPLQSIIGTLFCGPAAVMVFFVVSGFCIHYPYARGQTFHCRGFLLSRLTRILIPMLAATAIFRWSYEPGELNLILWSVYCEMIYYAMYPLLRACFTRIGVTGLIVIAFAISLCLIIFYPWQAPNAWKAPGHGITALLLAPGWLLGCLLAENQRDRNAEPTPLKPSLSRLWMLRSAVIASSAVIQAMHFHSAIGYRFTLPLFSLLVFVWLLQEFKNTAIPSWIGNAGKACYSIYLMHLLCVPVATWLAPQAGRAGKWCLHFLFAGLIATLFYWIIERPSHQLARRLRHL